MKFDPNKDLYLIIGVSANATNAEIVKAFKARTRILHPDRFDRKTQSAEWSQANEMQTDLNVAFQILRDSHSRNLYDEFRGFKKRSSTGSSAEVRQHPGHSKREVRTSIAPYTEIKLQDLPEITKEKILKRQGGGVVNQVSVSAAPLLGAWIRTGISLSILWFIYTQTKVSESWGDGWIFYMGFIWFGVHLGLSGAERLHKNYRANLKPNYYLTPLYFIKAEYDFLWIWPLTAIEQLNFRDHYHNGVFTGRTISFHFNAGTNKIEFKTYTQGEEITSKYNEYIQSWNKALEHADYDYFVRNNDFNEIRSMQKTSGPNPVPRGRATLHVVSFFSALVVFVFGLCLNSEYVRRHPKASNPNQYNFNKPLKSNPTSLSKYRPSYPVPSYPEAPLPRNGEVVRFISDIPKAGLKIDNLRGDHTLIKLVNIYTGAPAMTVFVQAGAFAEVKVPIGSYEVRYASGDKWYGKEHLFGPTTAYSKADENFRFSEEVTSTGYTTDVWSITLYKVQNGNLSTSTIDSSQF